MIDLGLERDTTSSSYVKWKVREEMFESSDGEVDLSNGFCVDPESLKTGFGKIQPGMSPTWVWDLQAGILQSNPGKDEEEKKLFKPALSLEIFTKKEGYLIWTTNALGACRGINNIIAQCYDESKQNPGKVAVFKHTGAEEKKFKAGGTSIPQFEFLKWADRPEGFSPPEPEPEKEITNDNSNDEDIPF